MTYCWFEPKDGYTCMLAAKHDGPHEPTSDNDILISLAPPEASHIVGEELDQE